MVYSPFFKPGQSKPIQPTPPAPAPHLYFRLSPQEVTILAAETLGIFYSIAEALTYSVLTGLEFGLQMKTAAAEQFSAPDILPLEPRANLVY